MGAFCAAGERYRGTEALMHVRRLAIALTTAAALTAAGAPAARADIGFLVMPGFASAETDGEAPPSSSSSAAAR